MSTLLQLVGAHLFQRLHVGCVKAGTALLLSAGWESHAASSTINPPDAF